MPKIVRVHVTYSDSKRILPVDKGDKVGALRYHFLRGFSDVLSDEISPRDVKFKRYDDSFKDFIDLTNDEILKEDIAVCASTSKQTTRPEDLDCQRFWPLCMYWPFEKCRMAFIDLVNAEPVFSRFHKIKPNVNYRLWNPVSRKNDSLIQFDSRTNTVSCNGNFSQVSETAVLTTDEGTRSNPSLIGLTFVRDSGTYAIAGNGPGNDVTVTAVNGPLSQNCIFEPLYYWSYTMFKNVQYSSYLGCADATGKLTLVSMDSNDFPNPQALFIANTISPATPLP